MTKARRYGKKKKRIMRISARVDVAEEEVLGQVMGQQEAKQKQRVYRR